MCCCNCGCRRNDRSDRDENREWCERKFREAYQNGYDRGRRPCWRGPSESDDDFNNNLNDNFSDNFSRNLNGNLNDNFSRNLTDILSDNFSNNFNDNLSDNFSNNIIVVIVDSFNNNTI